MRILHSVLDSAALSATSSPSPEKIVQVGAAEGASSSASVSPEPLGRSAALRQTDFPSLMQVRPRTQRTPVGGDRQRLDRPPHRRGSSLRLWGGKPEKSRRVGVMAADGQTGLSITWLIRVRYMDPAIIDQTTNGITCQIMDSNTFYKIILHLKDRGAAIILNVVWGWIDNGWLINGTKCHVWKKCFKKWTQSCGFPVWNTGLFISHFYLQWCQTFQLASGRGKVSILWPQ